MVDTQGYAAAVGKLGEDGLFLGGRRVFPDDPRAAVAVAYDIVVGEKFDCAGQDTVKKVLCTNFFHLLRRQNFWFAFQHFSSLPPFRRQKEDAYP